eukprot:2912662-Rhodomonas_salina.1
MQLLVLFRIQVRPGSSLPVPRLALLLLPRRTHRSARASCISFHPCVFLSKKRLVCTSVDTARSCDRVWSVQLPVILLGIAAVFGFITVFAQVPLLSSSCFCVPSTVVLPRLKFWFLWDRPLLLQFGSAFIRLLSCPPLCESAFSSRLRPSPLTV